MKLIEQLRAVTPRNATEAEIIAILMKREERREKSGLNDLLDKFIAARDKGLDINERDKTRLLALLLDEKLAGVGNYEGVIFSA